MALHVTTCQCPFVKQLLGGVIGLTSHDEISAEFAFQGSRCIGGVEAMPCTIARSEGIRNFVEGWAGGFSLPTPRAQELSMSGSSYCHTGSTAFPWSRNGVGV